MVDVMRKIDDNSVWYLLGFTSKGAIIAPDKGGKPMFIFLSEFTSKFLYLDEDIDYNSSECVDCGDQTPLITDDGTGIIIEVPVADGVYLSVGMDDVAAEEMVKLVSNKLNGRWKK